MSLALPALLAWGALLTVLLWACAAASWSLFRARRPVAKEPLLPMTVIKPIRGWDRVLEKGLLSLIDSDPEGRLQLIVALESRDDPAFAAAAIMARAHPERDITVLVTGPSGRRMGKMHNMIEALPRARHPVVIFSDADARATRALVEETSRAFREGCEAAYALPVHARVPGLGGLLYQLAFQHFFDLGAAFNEKVLGFPFCAGAWMAFSRPLLDRLGGLEPFARAIADDYALSRGAWRLGAKSRQLPVTVTVRESGGGLGEAFVHLSKWAVIIRWTLPAVYALCPLLSPVVVALAAWGLAEAAGTRVAEARALLAAAVVSRVLVGRLQELAMRTPRMPLHGYLALAVIDPLSLGVWAVGWRRVVRWRGTAYRLVRGGQAEVLSAP